jgi:hypothetical protein
MTDDLNLEMILSFDRTLMDTSHRYYFGKGLMNPSAEFNATTGFTLLYLVGFSSELLARRRSAIFGLPRIRTGRGSHSAP